ncbi:MAG: MBL fold metallo-hydrolase [Holosporaceae bacterium]|jgi:phosphoribosyl 1,2-cyclic phosphate phosphodiesterase|nr:MBL fold metallo-hydrolase [Holosporaceae bacterium]
MKITVLGSGSSVGVPSLKYGWGNCDNNNPKNYRTRSSIIIESGTTTLLIDMSPDLRQQLLNYGSDKIDAVIFTHAHYDHTIGINELRPIFLGENKALHAYAKKNVICEIKKMFFYLFENSEHEIYKPYISLHLLEETFTIGDISGICFDQNHGFSKSLGIRIGNFAYSTDIAFLDDEIIHKLQGIDTWIVECLSIKTAKPTHAHLDLTLDWIKKINPRKAFLTHMDISMDYDALRKILPENVEPAYDQMSIYL